MSGFSAEKYIRRTVKVYLGEDSGWRPQFGGKLVQDKHASSAGFDENAKAFGRMKDQTYHLRYAGG